MGIKFYLGGGLGVCHLLPRLARPLIRGSALLAVMQVAPVLQLMAGLIALQTFGFGFGPTKPMRAIDCFFVTMFTGAILFGIAAFFGAGLEFLWMSYALLRARLSKRWDPNTHGHPLR